MGTNYVRGSKAILAAFDLSNPKETLKIAKKYLATVHASVDDPLLFLVGTKADLLMNEKEKRTAHQIGQRFADNNSMVYVETSVKDSTNIKELLLKLSRLLLAM